VFRRREPQAARPYKVWGYPLVPILFVIASAVLLCYSFAGDWPYSAMGTGVILVGIPFFYYFAGRRPQSSGQNAENPLLSGQ
jgi:APA family basic amino acid/polyamine antiporter